MLDADIGGGGHLRAIAGQRLRHRLIDAAQARALSIELRVVAVGLRKRAVQSDGLRRIGRGGAQAAGQRNSKGHPTPPTREIHFNLRHALGTCDL